MLITYSYLLIINFQENLSLETFILYIVNVLKNEKIGSFLQKFFKKIEKST